MSRRDRFNGKSIQLFQWVSFKKILHMRWRIPKLGALAAAVVRCKCLRLTLKTHGQSSLANQRRNLVWIGFILLHRTKRWRCQCLRSLGQSTTGTAAA